MGCEIQGFRYSNSIQAGVVGEDLREELKGDMDSWNDIAFPYDPTLV